jgi:hypothetical protein
MFQDFKYSYYMYLTDHLFRESMLKNGLDALTAGNDSENIVLLSCASSESDSELISTFISAAYELGVELPKTDEYGIWVADSYFDLVEAGIELPAVDIQVEFKRYLLVIHNEIAKIAKYDQSLHRYNVEFGKFLEVTGFINNYQDWLDELCDLAKGIENRMYREFSIDSSNIILDVSYGATTRGDVSESHRIAVKLKTFNNHKERAEQGVGV